MRGHPLRRLTLGLGLALAASAAAGGLAQEPAPSVALEAPPGLAVGDRAGIVARVRMPGEAPLPLLLTPTAEGTAVEVVRGRLLRSDARDPAAAELVFRIPIVARAPGDAVVRVAVDGYVCEPRCRAVQAEAALRLHVAAQRQD